MTFKEFKKAMDEYDEKHEHIIDCIGWHESQECCVTKEHVLKFIYGLFNEHK